jgi:hypothetical protein
MTGVKFGKGGLHGEGYGRVTPIEEFERFAERLYNYNPEIQTKLDFDNTFKNFMEGIPNPSKVLKEVTWNILKSDYHIGTPEMEERQKKEGGSTGTGGRKQKSNKVKVEKNKAPLDHIANIYDKRKGHDRIVRVSMNMQGNKPVYRDKFGRIVKVNKADKVKRAIQ